ncbi:DUF362 domain-containing protein [Clostridium sp. D2Q-11]|uniref:DUF362 domain-containing protein n=1 Tax=Anaeromonas frigoriresistens TaxID=2683708 RepID=A0A942Z8C5_9FIRM|nr:DUF362 domain-containing protein [Anaeromonas frigoriresistens]MBS4537785.1 DUF362 domain-containing protein [Anaeromonas frigoriresistens]
MKSKVYFINFRSENKRNNIHNKIQRLFEKADIKNVLTEGDITAIKVHFGEKGRHAYLHPTFARQIVDKTKEYGAQPFLTDTNTLYTGSRTNSVDHIKTAIENGFAYSVVNAPVIIADGLYSKNSVDVEINQKNCKTAKIAGDIYNSNSMIVLSHVKGHGMAGFGGTIKNIAMGCASASGKQIQHSDSKPSVIDKKCISCGICIENCPVDAIEMKNKAFIHHDICIGCGECTTVCPKRAIEVQWETDSDVFLEKMAEYAYGAVKNKDGKVAYFNFVMNVTPLCDCVPWNDVPIVNDIGILASFDPVAIDKASVDLIDKALGNKDSQLPCDHQIGDDKFKSIHKIDGKKILDYCEEIGLGTKEYDLIEVK